MTEFDKLLLEKIQQAGLEAQKRAMEVMGYIVVFKNQKLVKIYKDGNEEDLKN